MDNSIVFDLGNEKIKFPLKEKERSDGRVGLGRELRCSLLGLSIRHPSDEFE